MTDRKKEQIPIMWPFSTKARKAAIETAATPSVAAGPVIYLLGTPGQVVSTTWTEESAILEGLKVDVWINACVRLIADAFAQAPLTVQVRDGDQWIADPLHPLQALLDRPNRQSGRSRMARRVAQHLLLAGNALIFKNRDARGIVRELLPLHADAIKPVSDDNVFISHYVDQSSRQYGRTYEAGDIIHCMLEDPSNPFWGLSPMQSLAALIDTDVASIAWNSSLLTNGGKYSAVLAFEDELTQEQVDIVKANLALRSGPTSAGSIFVTSGKMSFHEMSISPKEMDWTESQKQTGIRICAGFGVPVQLIADVAGTSTYNNYETALRAFWQLTMKPLIDDVADCFNRMLAPDFAVDKFNPDVRIVADYGNIDSLQSVSYTEAQSFDLLVRNGIPVNEAVRAMRFDIPQVDGGDVPFFDGQRSTVDPMLSDQSEL